MNMTQDLNTKINISQNPIAIAEQFKSQGKILHVQEYGSGNINSTYLVTLDSHLEKHFILQRINTQVFCQPELVMGNMRIFTEHVCAREAVRAAPRQERDRTIEANRRWEIPRIITDRDDRDYWIAPDRSFWRAISFIDNAQTFDTIQDRQHAQEIGYGLAMFHNLISDLPVEKLADTLEGFHITPRYLKHFERVLAQVSTISSPEVDYCLQFISDRSTWAHVLENAKAKGELNLRLIHGDPKINNIMIDLDTKQAIGMIDLDTVKPGLIHYDLGDCLRSGCNPFGEEIEDWERVSFDTDLCQDILQGYLSVASNFLTENDYRYIYDAIRLISFELGLRFFTDYLEGNIYFKTKYPEHNLIRALVQFQLTASIERKESAIRAIIGEI